MHLLLVPKKLSWSVLTKYVNIWKLLHQATMTLIWHSSIQRELSSGWLTRDGSNIMHLWRTSSQKTNITGNWSTMHIGTFTRTVVRYQEAKMRHHLIQLHVICWWDWNASTGILNDMNSPSTIQWTTTVLLLFGQLLLQNNANEVSAVNKC